MAIADNCPNWLTEINYEQYNNPDFIRILVFYVFHCPCENISARGISLNDYGWTEPWRKPYKLNEQLKQATSNHNLIFSAHTYNNMDIALEKANLLHHFSDDVSTERICIYDNKDNQFLSIFGHIRNAFAHGRFLFVKNNDEEYYIMEDVKSIRRQKVVTARIILKKSSLLNWIDIIEGGQTEYQQH